MHDFQAGAGGGALHKKCIVSVPARSPGPAPCKMAAARAGAGAEPAGGRGGCEERGPPFSCWGRWEERPGRRKGRGRVKGTRRRAGRRDPDRRGEGRGWLGAGGGGTGGSTTAGQGAGKGG